jgi:hypothetical protein
MKKLFFFIVLLYCIALSAAAQFCNSDSGECYGENACFTNKEIDTQDYKYATVHNIYKSSTASVQLYMTVYSPCGLPTIANNGSNLFGCLRCKRPFILIFHGGGFRDGCKNLMRNECLEFAKRGYVAAAIDYRLGWVKKDEKRSCSNFCYTDDCAASEPDNCTPAYNDSLNFAVYRAIQDASAAMRYIVHNADNFNIDTNYLYVEGFSAGSIIAINLSYMNQGELDNAMPGARAVLGDFNSNGNRYKNTYRIAGLFNNWGSIKDTSFIKASSDAVPMIAFHGIDDSIVPFGKGNPLGCKNGAYGYSYGSSSIYTRLTNKFPKLPVELYACYGDHGIFIGDPTISSKSLYRIQKAVCFFKRARNGDKTQKYVQINKNETDITYDALKLISPVSCNVKAYNSVNASANSFSKAETFPTDKKLALSIWPNPVLSVATLFIKGKFNNINIAVTNLLGQVLWMKENIQADKIEIPVKEFTSGMYIVHVKTGDWQGTINFMKVN